MMPYLAAVFGFSSTLSLTIFTLSPSWPAISSSAGAIIRHGPHHSAQKSTTTGPVAFRTWASKSASETLLTVMVHLGEEKGNRVLCVGAEPMYAARKRQGGSRRGVRGERGIERFAGNLHQYWPLGPYQRGAHWPAREKLLQHVAIERKLPDIAGVASLRFVDGVGNAGVGFVVRDQHGLRRDHEPIDLADDHVVTVPADDRCFRMAARYEQRCKYRIVEH